MTDDILRGIFKAYDIRGKVGSELTGELACAIGRAVADYLPARGEVVVGYDMRPDSQALAAAFRSGLTQQGRDVLNVGQVTSDMVYFAVGQFDLAGGAVITASHNPGQDNGIKIYRDQARPVGLDSGLALVRDAVAAGSFKPAPSVPGQVTEKNIIGDWIKHCLTFVTTPLAPFHIAIDAGNGMAGKILPEIQKRLPLHIRELYYELDGTFPNHEANPTKPENLRDLIAVIQAEQLDFGIAFDGDGDRAGFVDDRGRPVSGSDLITVIARHILAKQPGAEIVHEIRTSRATRELIKRWGGRTLRTKAGRTSIGAVMREHDAPFGGETSGHLFFKDNYFTDSGLIGALVAMVAITESGQRLSDLIDQYHTYAMGPEQNFRVTDSVTVLDRLAQRYNDGRQDWLDGLTVDYPNWWFNLRRSNTESVVRLNVEAINQQLLEEKAAEVVATIKEAA